jgi:uroporphyrinogen III methyltransferase/synthase
LKEFGLLVADVHTYDWLIFTSPNGVEAFFEMFLRIYKDVREIGGVRIAAIGPATAAKVAEFHLQVDLQPKEFVAEGVLAAFKTEGSVENLKILIARAEYARDVLPAELTKQGAIVDVAIAYRTVAETEDVSGGQERLRSEGADLITFTSSSTAENFMKLGIPLPATTKTASIGPVTSKTMKDLGLSVDVEAKRYDIPGLVDAICRFYGVASPEA